MEHESTFALMMDALDGDLSDENGVMLESHLHSCSECAREWHALQAIDTLFRQTPVVSPAADFAQRTIAALPNRKARRWAISSIYALLLLSGIIPIILVGWVISVLSPLLAQPTLIDNITNSITSTVQVIRTVILALFNGVGEVIVQQPTIIGWLLVMAGIVFVWSGVYRQLLYQPQGSRSELTS